MGSRHPALHGSNPVPVADECTSQTARHVRSGHPHHHHGKEPYAAVQCRSELLGRKAERRPKLTWSPRNAGPAPLPNGAGQFGLLKKSRVTACGLSAGGTKGEHGERRGGMKPGGWRHPEREAKAST